jgi:hypothetical protein
VEGCPETICGEKHNKLATPNHRLNGTLANFNLRADDLVKRGPQETHPPAVFTDTMMRLFAQPPRTSLLLDLRHAAGIAKR